MSEPDDPLEAELSALRPRDGSSELRARIDAHRARSLPPGSRWRWGLTLGGGLAAACVAAAILLPWGSGRRVVPKQAIVRVRPEPPVEVEDTGPSPLAYRRALARSPDELDALIDKDARVAPGSSPELARIFTSTRPDAALRALLGED